jgi:hypothetical protein
MCPIVVAAEGVGNSGQLLSTMVNAANSERPVEVARQALEGFALSTMNNSLNVYSAGLLDDRWKYLSLSLGTDRGRVQLEGMSVYGIHENQNWFVFNQTSLVNYDSRTTLNFGLGARHINDAETVIVGGNVFYDHEFGSLHRRAGVGAEVLTSLFQLRSNYYKALSGERLYDGIYEEALDGYDVKFTYELPYFYSSNMYLEAAYWHDGGSFSTSSQEFGLTAEVAPNLILNVAANQIDNRNTQGSATLTYRYVFGSQPERRVQRDGVFRFALEPIRHMLYEPVQRENRIMKKSVTLGVTVSGF